MKQIKKLLSFVLSVLLILAIIPFADIVNVSAVSNIVINGVDIGYAVGDYFTKNGKSCATSAFSNGTCHGHDICVTNTDSRCNCLRYWPSKENCQVDLKATQCFGFARYCQWKVYGYHDGNAPSKFKDLTGNISESNCTAATLKSKLLGCASATHIRTGDNGHSMVVVSTSSTNIQIVACNNRVNGVKVCIIYSNNYTWEAFATYLKGRGGISYAKAYINGSSSSNGSSSVGGIDDYTSTNPDDYKYPERTLKYTSPTMKGDDVAWVQAVLYQLGYSIEIDGSYGQNSVAVIKQFQSNYGLTVDGYCGPATRAKLLELWNAKKHTHSYTQYAESAHPHKTYKKCSCGDTYYTGATENRWLGSSYEAAHPHKVYRTCSCGYTEYTGNYQTIGSCNNCIDNSFVSSMEYNGHTYALYNINTTWENAKAFCESKGGYLATITSKSEWDNVKDFNGNRCTWIGGYLDSSSVWRWVTNEHFVFTSWYPGEPNNANNNEKYIGIYADAEWNDFPNNSEVVYYFICEYGSIETNHSYSNSCDTTCNICGEVRAINHTYSNDCDSSCNICGFTRTPSWHVYTNACDSTCNECGIKRIISNHNYEDCFDGYKQQSYGSWSINVTKTGVYTIEPSRTIKDYSKHSIEIYDKNNNKVLYNEKKQGWPLVENQKYTIQFRYVTITYYNMSWNLTKTADTVFKDTYASEWYNNAIAYVVGRNIMSGYGSTGLFGTADNIQRQDFMVMLARLDGVDLSQYVNKISPFSDVPNSSDCYYKAAVIWGYENGIVSGYANGKFGTGDKITREQLVKFLYNYANYKGLDTSYSTTTEKTVKSKYKDYKNVSDWAQDAVLWAIENNVIKGKTDTTIVPYGNALRCEVAQIMYNIFLNDLF